MIIDEFHELPEQTQRNLRVELDGGWKESFLIGTASDPKEIDNALRDRMFQIHLLQPSKTPLVSWIMDICLKSGVKVTDSKAVGLLVDLTAGRFRAILKVLQGIYDRGWMISDDSVRKAAGACGYRIG
jgi:hypothetical protein